jgi:membrane-associated phospholipid phosphatase
MLIRPKNPYHHFRIAVGVSLLILLVFVIILLIYGKTDSFLLINGAHNSKLDFVMPYVTWLGDGLIYVPMVLYCLVFNRKFLVPAIFSIIICTVLTQGMKRYIFPDELRPFSLEEKQITIHKIEGVHMNKQHSFPSGHTSTAFTTALLLTAVLRRRVWAYVLPFLAFLVGYSRIYLAQHYLTDVSAGLFIGIVSAYLALLLYESLMPKKEQHI